MHLSLIIPAYNEAQRITPTLAEIADYQATSSKHIEVVVVDDGSSDGTAALAESWADRIEHLLVVRQPKNMGKGKAVATGMLTARGAHRAFFDADGSTPIAEVDKLLAAAHATPRSVAIGSLGKYGNRDLRVPQPLVRTVLGRAGNALIKAMVLPGVDDSQRGCKLFPADVAAKVFAVQRTSGWGFDIEVLALCQRLGYDVVEVPIQWKHVAGGSIGAAAYANTLREVVRIRRLFTTDAYGLESGIRTNPVLSPTPARQPA